MIAISLHHIIVLHLTFHYIFHFITSHITLHLNHYHHCHQEYDNQAPREEGVKCTMPVHYRHCRAVVTRHLRVVKSRRDICHKHNKQHWYKIISSLGKISHDEKISCVNSEEISEVFDRVDKLRRESAHFNRTVLKY